MDEMKKNSVEQAAEEYFFPWWNKEESKYHETHTNHGRKIFKAGFTAGNAWTLENASEGFQEWYYQGKDCTPREFRSESNNQFYKLEETWQAVTLAAEKKHKAYVEFYDKKIMEILNQMSGLQDEREEMLKDLESIMGLTHLPDHQWDDQEYELRNGIHAKYFGEKS